MDHSPSPGFLDHLISFTFTPDCNNPNPPTSPPPSEPDISQGALNLPALFDLGRSGVSVPYKPTASHE